MLRSFCKRSCRRTTSSVRRRHCLALFSSSKAQPQKGETTSEQQELLEEARALTLSLYRLCVRSVRLIRHGNEEDERDFQQRERARLQPPKDTDPRLSMLSMLPPVNREDELRSRAEYYLQYARENFVQESDCLVIEDGETTWQEANVARYLHHLRKGDEHRKWLLADMQFTDRYTFDQERANRFEERTLEFLRSGEDPSLEELGEDLGDEESHGNEDFFDDDDEEEDIPIEWIRKHSNRSTVDS